MKRIALFTAALMILSFGLASAQDQLFVNPNPTGSWAGDTKVNTGTPIVFTIHMRNSTDLIAGGTWGFEVYMSVANDAVPDAAIGTFGPISSTNLVDFGTNGMWDGGYFTNFFGNDGTGADTVGYGGFSITKPGIPTGFNQDITTIATVGLAEGDQGEYLCIDTAFYPPGGAWLWSTPSGDVLPAWPGHKCWLIEKLPDPPAEFLNCPTAQLSFDHCFTATYDFEALDQGTGAGPVVFGMVSGIGGIDPVTGIWSFSPTLANVGPVYPVVVKITDLGNNVTECAFDVVFTNVAPSITCKPKAVVGKVNPVSVTIVGTNNDCDPGSFSVTSVTPTPDGSYSINPNTGVLTFNTAVTDCPTIFDFVVRYSDGNLFAECTQQI